MYFFVAVISQQMFHCNTELSGSLFVTGLTYLSAGVFVLKGENAIHCMQLHHNSILFVIRNI